MERLDYEKIGELIRLTNNNGLELEIGSIFGGNIDFTLFHDRPGDTEFVISKDDYKIYELFSILYDDIKESRVLPIDGKIYKRLGLYYIIPYDEWLERLWKQNREYQSLPCYSELFVNDEIVCKSQDSDFETPPSFRIKKLDDSFVIVFDEGDNPEQKDCISVHVSLYNSRYKPYNVVFERFMKSLLKLKPEDRQIQVEELLCEEGKGRLRKK